jgi:hypothetical protein
MTDLSAGETVTGVLLINGVAAASIDTYVSGSTGSLTLMGTGTATSGSVVPIRITLEKQNASIGQVRSIQVQLIGNVQAG